MPRYYFHISEGHVIPDPYGSVLPDLAAAKCFAVRYAGDLTCDLGAPFWEADDWRMTVADDQGSTLFALLFAGAAEPVCERLKRVRC